MDGKHFFWVESCWPVQHTSYKTETLQILVYHTRQFMYDKAAQISVIDAFAAKKWIGSGKLLVATLALMDVENTERHVCYSYSHFVLC